MPDDTTVSDLSPAYARYEIDTRVYDRSIRLVRFLKRFLHLHFKLHDPDRYVHRGQIFVLNHFARIETFIPQYLFHECCGAYCCAIAHRELFEIDEALSWILRANGAVPHDHPQLFPLLACQILRGRKVIIFPEGEMVKDRRAVDRHGGWRLLPAARERRKQHTGAAVLALGLDLFKQRVLQAARQGQEDHLEYWCRHFRLDPDTLLARCREPTCIVPANITFFPLRIDDNLIIRLITTIRPGLSKRGFEELLIESNLILRDTDMDIRLARPIEVGRYWHRWEHLLIDFLLLRIDELEDVFAWRTSPRWLERKAAARLHHTARHIRNDYMAAIYRSVTINLCHLAATLIYLCLDRRRDSIERSVLYQALYLAIKRIQREEGLFLHRGLLDPERYQALPESEPPSMRQFTCTAESAGLLESVGGRYHFLPKLCEEFDLHTIRLENPVAVYANEVAPLSRVRRLVAAALDEAETLTPRRLALLRFDDERRAWQWDRAFYSAPCFEEINRKEGPKISGEPFLLNHEPPSRRGVLLIHGLLASPAVMRPLGEELAERGYTVLGIRLKGHGTSPCDLRERKRQDWLDSVRRGYRILAGLCESIALVGFSTGGLLALQLAADQLDRIHGVVAVATPLRFRKPSMHLVPIVHQTNLLLEWLTDEGLKEFVTSPSEHPETNYTQVPVSALYELQQLIQETEARLAEVHCPVLLLQGDRDPVIDPDSAEILFEGLGTHRKTLTLIPATRHDIVYRDPGGVHGTIAQFLDLHLSMPS